MVAIDDRAAGKMAAEHLMECGFEQFGFHGQSGLMVSERRLEGLRAAVAAKGYPYWECPVLHYRSRHLEKQFRRLQLIQWLRALPKPVGIMGH